MICEANGCEKEIKDGDKYIHHTETYENFYSKECAQREHEQYLEELTLEPEEEE